MQFIGDYSPPNHIPVTGQMFLFLPHLKWVTIPLGYLTNAASLNGRLQTGHRLEKISTRQQNKMSINVRCTEPLVMQPSQPSQYLIECGHPPTRFHLELNFLGGSSALGLGMRACLAVYLVVDHVVITTDCGCSPSMYLHLVIDLHLFGGASSFPPLPQQCVVRSFLRTPSWLK